MEEQESTDNSHVDFTVEKLLFSDFVFDGIERGGFETDDALAAVLPLMEQTRKVHLAGQVAPLKGTDLVFATSGHLWFENASASAASCAPGKLSRISRQKSRTFDVVDSHDYTTDLDEGDSRQGANLLVAEYAEQEVDHPVYFTRHMSWEHAAGHHDQLTDIYSLGMILASVALGLDFADKEQLTSFVELREQVHLLNQRLHPSVAAMIMRMTSLSRHERVQDLETIIEFLKNYRDQPNIDDIDFSGIAGFAEANRRDKRSMINQRLRDRLFELTKRNRLVYFRATLQSVNLTVGSVPLLLDYENIRPDQILTWNDKLADEVKAEKPLSLNRYLRFEDAPWLPSALDNIRRDANRDVKEFGFAQLRVVIVFLRWHNLKEDMHHRIHSPLLLLPVELTKKKGIRDSYILQPSGTVAEVNPALRHFLKQLYDLDLPESIDLAETSVNVFFDILKRKIQASEPAIELKFLDRPQIDLVVEKAKKRLDLYQKRKRMSGTAVRSWEDVDYSYKPENFQPLGLQLFQQKVKPAQLPLEYLFSDDPVLRSPGISEEKEAEPVKPPTTPREKIKKRALYQMREGSADNPYVWDFDLCSLTLGNFNYRKMTLVRDYNSLLSEEFENPAFDEIFSLEPRDREVPPPVPPLSDQFLIVPSDPTQVSAISWARTGRNLIIQGPPGTGKSQTITNLIADYVARGKRVLFVCEKRAALDVVYHRLGQSGLDRLSCLIHDSQTDKKPFIMDLKDTYEGFLSFKESTDWEAKSAAHSKDVQKELSELERFGEAITSIDPTASISLNELFERLVALREYEPEMDAELEEKLPPYSEWLSQGSNFRQLVDTLHDLGQSPIYADSPVSYLSKQAIQADNPVSHLRSLLDETRTLIGSLLTLQEKIPVDTSYYTLDEWTEAFQLCDAAEFLADNRVLPLLDSESPEYHRYAAFERKTEATNRKLEKASELTTNWKSKLSPRDTEEGLAQARVLESSIFRFVQPTFWRLRKLLNQSYNFQVHAVRPSYSRVLQELKEEHDIRKGLKDIDEEISIEFGVPAARDLREALYRFQQARDSGGSEKIAPLSDLIASGSPEAAETVTALSSFSASFEFLLGKLKQFLRDSLRLTPEQLQEVHGNLEENLNFLPDLLPSLEDLVNSPGQFFAAISELKWEIETFEAAMARRSLNSRYREDRPLSRFEGWLYQRHISKAEKCYREWMKSNGPRIVNRVRRDFLESVRISSLPAAQLTQEEKLRKKRISKGRKELEHEFGKTMRYRSIRDLASDESGEVVLQVKPVWLMSPLSISDTLPLETGQFDVVIFDEASQIKLEEAIPTVFRAAQVIVVGDEMQLPPTNFFSAKDSRDESEMLSFEDEGEVIEYDLSAESFLSHSARNLPSTLLGWHYRSRHEALISYSNHAFYSGELLTIPDRKARLGGDAEILSNEAADGAENVDELLARSISFHSIENGVYSDRRNTAEADYIAHTVRELLKRETGLTIGIVAFSEAQQDEIESSLSRLGRSDEDFENRLAAEFEREEEGQFCGLFVKNLENVQGDERDIIILSVCYAPDVQGKMRMNFGPINQSGGEKRLNVIFSRSRIHMAVVSTIRHHQITNDYNDGANCLKGFLEYSAAVSKGEANNADRVLGMISTHPDPDFQNTLTDNPIIEQIRSGLEERGLEVTEGVGQSRFKVDLAVREPGEALYRVAIMIDGPHHYAIQNSLERCLLRSGILRAFGWKVCEVLIKDWYHNPDEILSRIVRLCRNQEEEERESLEDPEPPEGEPVDELPEPNEKTPLIEEEPPTSPPESDKGKPVYLEYADEKSSKFWEMEVTGESFTVRYGRIGTNGQTSTKTFPDKATAEREAEKMIRSKLKKGYREKNRPTE